MSGRGSRRRAARLLCAAAAVALAARAGVRADRTADVRRNLRRPTLPSSIRPRHSIRCRTSASTGPISRLRDTTAPAPTPRRSPKQAPTGWRRRQRRHPLHACRSKGLGADRRRRGSAPDVPAAIGAGSRSQGPGQRRPDRPPLARRRGPARASCCAARAITMRWSSRAPRASAASCASCSTADPGQQYRFASVELPGLEAAGADAAKLRDAFAVKAGDPVIAQDVIAGGSRSPRRSGEEGFAGAKIGEQDIEVDHQTHLATLDAAGEPGPVARFGAIHVSGRPPFSARHVATIARFKRGDPFKRSKIDDLRRALIATTLGRGRRHPGRARRRRPDGRPRRAAASPRRRTRSPASSATAPGRARASRRAGPTATSSIRKAR